MTTSTILMQDVSLGQVASVCLSLAELMEALMDPHSLAMITGGTGEIAFTRSGYRVLLERVHHHPLEKIIIQAVTKYHIKTGDDCKVFLLLLKELVNGAKSMLGKVPEIEARRVLSDEINHLMSYLPEILKSVRDKHASYTDLSFISRIFHTHLEGIILTSLASKFPLHISKLLTDLVCSFLRNSITDWCSAEECLCYSISNFDCLCSRILSPISESTTVAGFVLHHELLRMDAILGGARFIVVEDLSRRWNDAIWNVEAESFSEQLNHVWVHVQAWLDSLNQLGITVIISASGACEDFLSLSSENNITVMCRIPKEDVDNILHFSGVSSVNSINNMVESQNIGHLQSVKSVMGGKFHYTHLEIKTDRKSFKPNHILLCCLSDGQFKECHAEIINSLKIVKQWLKPGSHSRTRDDFAEDATVIPKVMCHIINSFGGKSEVCGVSLPVGSYEFFLRTVLKSVNKNKLSSYQNLNTIMDDALLEVICKCWNITKQKFNGETSFADFHAKFKSRLSLPVEPISSKEEQIYGVLQLVLQLLKIDAVVSSK